MKKSFTLLKLVHCTLILMIIFCFDVSGQQTKRISLQGFLKDANGKAIADGSQDVIFKLYTQESGGVAAWTEAQTLNVYGGVYSTHLGKTQSLESLDWGVSTYYVGVTIQGTELIPRTELTFAPYSLGAPKAQEVVCSGAVGDVKYSILNPTQFAAVNGSCWVPMDGRALLTTDKLRQITSMTSVPNGGGLFIRAQENSSSNNDPDRDSNSPIAVIQQDAFKDHQHALSNIAVSANGTTSSNGAHNHTVTDSYFSGSSNDWRGGGESSGGYVGSNLTQDVTTTTNGAHTHTVNVSGYANGITNGIGGLENRPKNINFYVYIRIN